jgi:autotransporter-associated beta strand protein
MIGGSGALTKSGTGTLEFSGGSNNYSGGTTITGGTLRVHTDESLGSIQGSSQGGITFSGNGGTLEWHCRLPALYLWRQGAVESSNRE